MSNYCVIPVSWDCDGQGNCYDPGTGNGQYFYTFISNYLVFRVGIVMVRVTVLILVQKWTVSECQSSCISRVGIVMVRVTVMILVQGMDNILHLICQSSCINSADDCDNQGNCYDPGTGMVLYSSIYSCESECVNVSVNEIGLNNFVIYPNPSQDVFNLEFSSTNINLIDIKITNLVGEIIYSNILNKFSGTYNQSIDLRMYSKGVYLFELNTENGSINKKLILQ